MSHSLIAELSEQSPIIIQNSSNPSSQKNLDVQPYDHTTVRPYKVLLLTCMVNCTMGTPTPRLCSVVQWSVHWAPSQTTRVLVLAGARCCALETCGKKKMWAPLLGLVKSICYLNQLNINLLKNKLNAISVCTNTFKGTTWMDIPTNVS